MSDIEAQAREAIARGHLDPMLKYTTDAFVQGYVTGWRDRAVAELDMVVVTRDYLADLERRSRLWQRAES